MCISQQQKNKVSSSILVKTRTVVDEYPEFNCHLIYECFIAEIDWIGKCRQPLAKYSLIWFCVFEPK
jgi:hypothetical protein